MKPSIGTTAHVWPNPGDRVRSHDPAIINRYFTPEGAALPWSQWLEQMFDQGHVHLTDPRAKPRAAAPTVTAPAIPPPAAHEVK